MERQYSPAVLQPSGQVFCLGMIAGLVARAGMQYEPEVYQPRGQVPTLTTGLWRPTTVESTSANMNGCADYYNSSLWCGGF